MSKPLNLYHYEDTVSVLGPGKRSVLWFQGCLFDCDGCLVPQSHPQSKNIEITINDMYEKIISNQVDGITISGGEPFLQVEGLRALLYLIKNRTNLSVMIFTGYLLEQLKSFKRKEIDEIINWCDILVDGKFEQKSHVNDPWRGSANQKIHFLTSRYGVSDYLNAHKKSIEFHIKSNGEIFQSGIPYSSEQLL